MMKKFYLKFLTASVLLGSGYLYSQINPALEMAGPASGNGVVTSYTATLQKNTNNPTGNTFTAYAVSSPLTVNIAVTNNVFTNGIFFGDTTVPAYVAMTNIGNVGTPAQNNSQYTSYGATAGTGIDRDANFGVRVSNDLDRAGNKAGNGRIKFGEITITYSRGTNNPLVHFKGLGGLSGTTSFTAEFTVKSILNSSGSEILAGTTLSRKSGNLNLLAAPRIDNDYTGNTDAATVNSGRGTVLFTNDDIKTIVLEVFTNRNGTAANFAWTGTDAYVISTSVGESDLEVTKIVNNATPIVGSNVIFTVAAKNNGASNNTNVSVLDQLPTGYTYVSHNAPTGTTYVPGTGVWTVGNLADQATSTLTVTATVKASGNYNNTAVVSTTSGIVDPSAGNNTASATVTPSVVTYLDSDGDGVPDYLDLDSDNDGILDSIENPCNLARSAAWAFTGANATSTNGTSNFTVSNAAVSGSTALTYTPNGTFNTTNFWSNPALAGKNSLEFSYFWDTTPEPAGEAASDDSGVRTFTINFSKPQFNVILNIDRLGGSGTVDDGTQPYLSNSAKFTLTTANVTLSKLAGNTQFEVTTDSFFRSPNVNLGFANPGSEASNTVSGTAAGSIKVSSLEPITSLTFQISAVGVEGFGNDGVEMIIEGCDAKDTDGDGIPDYLDLDSDNDGCPDSNEYYNTNSLTWNPANVTVDADGKLIGAGYNGTNYNNVVVATRALITTEPVTSRNINAGANTTFSVVASSTNTTVWNATNPFAPNYTSGTNNAVNLRYQWQVSTNSGSTWSDLTNAGVYSGVNTATLNITGATVTLNNNQFRAIVKLINNICTNLISTVGVLTINATACYEDAYTGAAGVATNHGITLLKRAGADNGNWPMNRLSAHTVLESNTKGFVITRVATADLGLISIPQEGMMVYDVTVGCLKIYDGTAWSCFSTATCP